MFDDSLALKTESRVLSSTVGQLGAPRGRKPKPSRKLRLNNKRNKWTVPRSHATSGGISKRTRIRTKQIINQSLPEPFPLEKAEGDKEEMKSKSSGYIISELPISAGISGFLLFIRARDNLYSVLNDMLLSREQLIHYDQNTAQKPLLRSVIPIFGNRKACNFQFGTVVSSLRCGETHPLWAKLGRTPHDC